MTTFRIAASILSCDLTRLGEEVRSVVAAGADWIHFDVMDNHYVPNLSFGPMVCAALRKHAVRPDGSAVPIDVHLMVRPVDALAQAFAKAGADRISFHVDATTHVDRTLQLLHVQGVKAGLVFSPAVPLSALPQRSPLIAESGSERFVSMVDAYDPVLRAQARSIAAKRGITLHEGVYAWALGPQFETPAEIRMLRQLGADAVGMSTVPETILARHVGMRVLALSIITNMATGLASEPLSHAHTLAQAQGVNDVASSLLFDIIAQMQLPS